MYAVARRPRRLRSPGPRGVLWAVALGALLAPLATQFPGGGTEGPGVTAAGGLGGNVSTWCPATSFTTNSARNVTLAGPSGSVAKGDVVSATYEIRVYATNLSPLSVRVYVPTLMSIFPLANAPALRVHFSPHTFVLNSTAWTSGAKVASNQSVTGALTFAPSGRANLYSARIAVMAEAPYGTLALDIRWNWTVHRASTGTSVFSGWSASVPRGAGATVFDPAPYVNIVATNNRNVTIGENFQVQLAGAVAHTRFFEELENASSGHVFNTNFSYALRGNATPFTEQVPILATNAPLVPGTILEHVRNNCMALLYSLSLHARYASVANVTFAISVAGCGPIVYNRTSYANSTVGRLTPSPHPATLGVGACSGHRFVGWTVSGGVRVQNATSNATWASVVASGGIEARFR